MTPAYTTELCSYYLNVGILTIEDLLAFWFVLELLV